MSLKLQRNITRADKLIKKGQYKNAKEIYLSILNSYPDNKIALDGLQKLDQARLLKLKESQLNYVMKLYSSGSIHQTQNALQLLIKDYPNEPVLFNLIGACYSEVGSLESAISNFLKAIELKSDYYEAYYNLGVAFQKNSQTDDATISYKKAIAIKHAYPQAHNNLGVINLEKGVLDTALKHLEWSVAFNPNYAEAQNNLGAVLKKMMHFQKALIHFQKASELNPNYAQAFNNLGISSEIVGKYDEAIINYDKALKINPNYAEAYHNLSLLKNYHKDDTQISHMMSMYLKSKLNNSDKTHLCFALAKVNNDLGNHDEFFKFLNEGNQLRKKVLGYSHEASKKIHDNLIKMFESKNSKKINFKKEIIKPIFIVGMPRSGTSLVEQIIASHNSVFGAGELKCLNEIVSPIFESFNTQKSNSLHERDLLLIRQKYLDFLKNLNVTENTVTDKMPLNFRLIGVILSAIPEAKIIHIKRDAVATCWSNYKHSFSSGNGFSFDQNDLVKFYVLYTKMMNYWHQSFPNKIYDINYEKLTTNQEDETKKLLKYCELDWDESCLKFYDNKRAVQTASASQVRQKLYQGSSDAWKKYESYLKPLIDGLKSY